MKRHVLALAVAASLFAAAPSTAADRTTERGIVQSLSATAVVLRSLDGSEVTVPLGPATRYRLNGLPAAPSEIRPGFVAEVVIAGDGSALAIRAFGRTAGQVRTGLLVRIGPGWIALRRPRGPIRIATSDRTRVRRDARRLALRALAPGMRVRVTLARDGTAGVVLITRPPAATG